MDLEPRRNGWCHGDAERHAQCPVTWGYYGSTVHVYRCDCPCHGQGMLW